MMMLHELLKLSDEVTQAIQQQKPIVVLESSIIFNGLPYPQNLKTASTIEQLIRDESVVPAMIALHQGKIHIGMDVMLMENLAGCDSLIKASKRDISFILSRKMSASTSIAATMFCANLAGLPIVVTAGIGGAHHNNGEGVDISADLIELSSTPITVVCSGAKSILDLPKTLEVLETHGVAVIGYKTNEFPAFYSHTSGIQILHRLDSCFEIATLMHYQRKLNIKNSIVVANPIPKKAEATDEKLLATIKQTQVNSKHINRKAITPSLLQHIAQLNAEQSLHANLELIKSNAILASKIAIAYQEQQSLS